MANERIELELSGEMAGRLRQAARSAGIADIKDAIAAAIGEWVGRHGDTAPPNEADEKYFVNEALDELAAKRRGRA